MTTAVGFLEIVPSAAVGAAGPGGVVLRASLALAALRCRAREPITDDSSVSAKVLFLLVFAYVPVQIAYARARIFIVGHFIFIGGTRQRFETVGRIPL
jgi:hypothetical protein